MTEKMQERLYDALTGEIYWQTVSEDVNFTDEPVIKMTEDEAYNYALENFKDHQYTIKSGTKLAIKIIKFAQDNDIEFIESKWVPSNKRKYYLNEDIKPTLEDKKYQSADWVSYEGCHDVVMTLNSDYIDIKIDVWDGDDIEGRRLFLNCQYMFRVERDSECWKFLLKNRIYPKAISHKANMLIKQLEEEEFNEKLNRAKELLNSKK